MKVTNTPYTVYQASSARKVEKSAGQGGDTSSNSSGYRQLSYEQLKRKVALLEQEAGPKTNLQSNIDPELAVSISASNKNSRFFDLQTYRNKNIDIVHDKSEVRGTSTNINI